MFSRFYRLPEKVGDMTEETSVVKQRPRRHVEIIPISQPPVQYIVFEEGGKRVAGYCLITASLKASIIIGGSPIKTAAIWHIYTDPDFRKQGYARNLITALKTTYGHIYSQGTTPEGRKLLIDNSFIREHNEQNFGPFKTYHWRR